MIRRLFVIFAVTLAVSHIWGQQYTVTGGVGEALTAVENANYRIKVFMVYGMENVRISYTSTSTSHKWYRYRTAVDEFNPEPVASTQNGTTSYITDVEDGCGYYVDENGPMRYYAWIVDYGKYEFKMSLLEVDPEVDPCVAVRFKGEYYMPDIEYYTPGGAAIKIAREFEVSYPTVKWDGERKSFITETHTETFAGDPFNRSYSTLPLQDTEIKLQGDLFARHFGVEKILTIPFYEAKAIEVHADTIVVSAGTTNVQGGGDALSAPAVIAFRAIANTPVASLFNWKIFNADEPDKPIIDFSQAEVEYTFNRAGTFIAKLHVSDRSGSCSSDEHSFTIDITETEMVIPNAFSPGVTVGINDIFRVKYKSIVKFRGWIYNRWGNELFSWTDPAQGWDGKYRGRYVPAGAYYYLIEYTGTDGKKHVRKGDVNVFRTAGKEPERPANNEEF
ncbi:MAG: gliding motility-associated C-terminal domain-containing protein [Tannerella sp.]|nr:gliding motility-associated C-terminal domain-containing protein [Tannerella sp.]